MLKIKMGGLYWPASHVRRILSAPRPEGAEPPAILDIGTGSGEGSVLARLTLCTLKVFMIGSWALGKAALSTILP